MNFSLMCADLVAAAVLPLFWIPMIIVFMLLWAFVVSEKGGWTTIFTAALCVMIAAKFPDIITFLSNPINIVLSIVAYGVIGVVWSHFKWNSRLNKTLDAYRAHRESFLKGKGFELDYFKKHQEDDETLGQYVQSVNNSGIGGGRRAVRPDSFTLAAVNLALAPRANDNKGSIVLWISHWPISMIWYVVADMLTDFANAIYRAVGGYFQRVSNAKFENM